MNGYGWMGIDGCVWNVGYEYKSRWRGIDEWVWMNRGGWMGIVG